MKNLYIESTKSTPKVEFLLEKNIFKIEGQSYPENSFKFYQPIIEWLETYLDIANKKSTFEFNFLYLNTSSSKCIMNIIDILEDAHHAGKDFVLNWYYDEENESLEEVAEEFKEDIEFNFNIIPVKID